MQTVDPLEARRWFGWKGPINWGISIVVFVSLFFVLIQFVGGLPAFLIALAPVFLLFFYGLDKRAIGIKCPHCGQYIETNTPWICGNKDAPHRNDQVDNFPFINHCQHCGFTPKAYQCHHCFKLIFLSEDKQVTAYAKCADIPAMSPKPEPVKKDPAAEEITKLDKGIQITERMVKKAELDVKLKEFKDVLEPQKPRTQKEAIEESFANFEDRNMTGAEIVRRKKAEVAEKYKDNPPELERQNRLIDQWARDHLDLM
jgi:DNA-directed RNA polymerase subunit RPC12/RpoP